jgi:autotransporter-associated beta strand protein
LPGTLNFNRQQFTQGMLMINGGTVNLVADATNTLLPGYNLAVNTGATLNLNGGAQLVAALYSANGGGQTELLGGTIGNTSANQATIATTSNTSFSGTVTGNVFVNKAGTGDWNLQSVNDYTGATLITGGRLNLQDAGRLTATSSITINKGTLYLLNWADTFVADRINDAAPITLNASNIQFETRAVINNSETLGAVSLASGFNQIHPNWANNDVSPTVFTVASLTRPVGSSATLRFNNLGNLGQLGRNNFIVTAGLTNTNDIIGPWAIIDREWASYGAYGVGGLSDQGFAGYSGRGLWSNPTGTDNVKFSIGATATYTLLSNVTVHTLNVSGGNNP